MNQEIINKYTDEILYNRLLKFNLKEEYVLEIRQNIKEQIYSLLYHWNDEEFRNGLLVVGEEEGKFYEPQADTNIKSFVVVAIRNSLLEVIFSVDHKKMELNKEVPEANVKLITSEAIEYFKNINFEELSKEIKKEKIYDKYNEIVNKYPMAWEALKQLGNCKGKKVIYENVKVDKKLKLEDLNEGKEAKDYALKSNDIFPQDGQSGISEEFSKELINQLKKVIENENAVFFYTDCFKMLTRNFEKLLKIIEILLENDQELLTSNYLITSNYIGKRQNLYRAGHNEMKTKLNDTDLLMGLSKGHADRLKKLIKMI